MRVCWTCFWWFVSCSGVPHSLLGRKEDGGLWWKSRKSCLAHLVIVFSRLSWFCIASSSTMEWVNIENVEDRGTAAGLLTAALAVLKVARLSPLWRILMSCYSIISIQFQCGYCLKGVRTEREKQRRTPTFNPPITFCSLLPFEIRELSKEVKFLEKKNQENWCLFIHFYIFHFSNVILHIFLCHLSLRKLQNHLCNRMMYCKNLWACKC